METLAIIAIVLLYAISLVLTHIANWLFRFENGSWIPLGIFCQIVSIHILYLTINYTYKLF